MAQEDSQSTQEQSSSGFALIKVILGLVFLPGFVVAFLFNRVFLRRMKLRPSVISVISGVVVITATLWLLLFAKSMNQFFAIVIYSNVLLGAIGGLIYSGWEAANLKRNPHLTTLEGDWSYQFEFEKTPLEKRRIQKTREALKNGELHSSDKAPIGINVKDGRPAYRYYSEANSHTIITGGTGYGKSKTLEQLIYNDILTGNPLVLIDNKATRDFAERLAVLAKKHGRPFYHFYRGSENKYPLRNLGVKQSEYDPFPNKEEYGVIADMLLSMREYDTAAATYKEAMKRLLQVITQAISVADPRKTPSIDWNHGYLSTLSSAIRDIGTIYELADACQGTEAARYINSLYNELKQSRSKMSGQIEELRGQLDTLLASQYGEWLRIDGDNPINLYELLNSNVAPVIVFSLNSDSEPEFVKLMGSLILSDITNVSARRREFSASELNQVMIYIDEFQTLNHENVKSILEKARSSKIALTLSLQSYDQIASTSETLLKSIIDTCGTFIAHGGSTYESAERLANIKGKSEQTIYSKAQNTRNSAFNFNINSKKNRTIRTDTAERYHNPPDEFMNLSKPDEANGYRSEAMIITKQTSDPWYVKRTKGYLVRKVHVILSSAINFDPSVYYQKPATQNRRDRVVRNAETEGNKSRSHTRRRTASPPPEFNLEPPANPSNQKTPSPIAGGGSGGLQRVGNSRTVQQEPESYFVGRKSRNTESQTRRNGRLKKSTQNSEDVYEPLKDFLN